MEKKLTAQGPEKRKSYTVTLPIEWVKENNLDKKRIVDLTLVGKKVVISTDNKEDKQIIIDELEYGSNYIKVLPGLYRAGYSEIKIINVKDFEKIIQIIEKKLIGYEIIEQKKGSLTIRDITNESEEEFGVILRRIFLLMLEYESCEVIRIRALDRNIKKLINYAQRILIQKGHFEYKKTPIYYLMLDRLEKLSDEFKGCLSEGKRNKQFIKIIELFRESYELFYKFNPKKYDKGQYESHALKKEIKLETNVKKQTIHLHNLARIINSFYGDLFMLKVKS